MSQSLLTQIRDQAALTMHVRIGEQMHSVALSSGSMNFTSAIIEAISNFNSQQGLELPLDPTLYEVYASKRSGKKKSDLPAFDKEQEVGMTGYQNFYLQPIYEEVKLKKKMSSLKSIETEISQTSSKKS